MGSTYNFSRGYQVGRAESSREKVGYLCLVLKKEHKMSYRKMTPCPSKDQKTPATGVRLADPGSAVFMSSLLEEVQPVLELLWVLTASNSQLPPFSGGLPLADKGLLGQKCLVVRISPQSGGCRGR